MATRLTAAARTLLPRFDTGYWSLYSLRGDESPLDYHDYVIGLLRKLATRTGEAVWREAADRFQGYESQPPVIRLGRTARRSTRDRPTASCDDGADPLLALEGVDGDAAGRREARPAAFDARREHVRLAGGLGRARNVPPVPDRGRAGRPMRAGRRCRRSPSRAAPGPPPLDVTVTAPATVSWRSDARRDAVAAPPRSA